MPNEKTKLKKKTEQFSFAKALPWVLIIGGLIGLVSFLVLTFDTINVYKNASYQPACNINPVVACGDVMDSWQADVLGLPNPFIGLMLFPIIITVGAMLLAGAKFKRWFWLLIQAGATLGVVFSYWLLFESIYSINAICPFCVASDVGVITIFWYVTLFNVRAGHIKLPKKYDKLASFTNRHHLDILVLWFLILIAIILQHFWYYYGTLL